MTRYYIRLVSIRPDEGLPKSRWNPEIRIIERSGIKSCREAAKKAVARGGWRRWDDEVKKVGRRK